VSSGCRLGSVTVELSSWTAGGFGCGCVGACGSWTGRAGAGGLAVATGAGAAGGAAFPPVSAGGAGFAGAGRAGTGCGGAGFGFKSGAVT
jgi:hypothetical protein